MTLTRITNLLTIAILTSLFLMIAAHVSEPIEESSPAWNCFAHGTRICSEPESEVTAWQAFDSAHPTLPIDTGRAHRVNYVGTAIIYPSLNMGEVAVSWEDGRWYVFRAEYIDK